jgi:DNA-binding NarL/FixJ family response regulator
VARSVQIAVLDPIPMFRRGIIETLGNTSFEPRESEELLAWSRQEPQRIVILSLETSTDWLLLARLRDNSPEVLVVAILTDVATPNFVRAVLAGAATAIPRDAPAEAVRRAFEAVVEGKSLLPIEVVRALSGPGERDASSREGESDPLQPHEVEWLRELARGVTVGQLASRVGYSERAMFRLLRRLYARMGVRNRTEALISAYQRGWLAGGDRHL